jgi:hypothetical protein
MIDRNATRPVPPSPYSERGARGVRFSYFATIMLLVSDQWPDCSV